MPVRNLARIAVGLAVTAAGAVSFAAPAAATSYAYVSATSSVYTDEAAPAKSFDTTDGAWVGSWSKNSVTHTSRAYYTFDLSAYKGAAISEATMAAAENTVNDCSVTRAVEVWQTDTPTRKITWNAAPAEKKLLFSDAGNSGGCPGYVGFDLLTAARQAIVGTGFLSFEVRVPSGHEADVAYGRQLAAFHLTVQYNHAPNAPVNLVVGSTPCGADPIWITDSRPYLKADLTDPDSNATGGGDLMGATFEVYPVGHPEQASDIVVDFAGYAPITAWGGVNDGILVDGGNYVFRVRSNDGSADSKWSKTCRFNVDLTSPTGTVAVTSTDYPADGTAHGGANVPGTFHFSANGDTDIVGFHYDMYYGRVQGYVAADRPGGTADVSVAPPLPGYDELDVSGQDRSGRRGPQTQYQFNVNDTAPAITDNDPTGRFGEPRHISVIPAMDNVVSYQVRLNNDPVRTVAANADGTGDFTVTPDQGYGNYLYVKSTTSAGIQSSEATYFFYVDTTPVVASDVYVDQGQHGGVGVAGTFTFDPRVPNVVSYTYAFDYGPSATVDADATGHASITWTPTAAEYHSLIVTSTSADGYVSDQTYYSFNVATDMPASTSDLYVGWTPNGGPGITGHYSFTAHQAGAVSFVYHFGDDADRTVPVGPDGTATIAFTPTTGGVFPLRVHTVDAGGHASMEMYDQASVSPMSPVVVETDSNGVYTFTLTSVLAGSTSFVYTLDSGVPQTVPVGADGTATFEWTPVPGTVHTLIVYTSTDGGLTSGTTSYFFYVSG